MPLTIKLFSFAYITRYLENDYIRLRDASLLVSFDEAVESGRRFSDAGVGDRRSTSRMIVCRLVFLIQLFLFSYAASLSSQASQPAFSLKPFSAFSTHRESGEAFRVCGEANNVGWICFLRCESRHSSSHFFLQWGETHSFDILYYTSRSLIFSFSSLSSEISPWVHRERVLSSSKVLACCCCYCPRCGEDNTLTLENVLIVLNLCIRHTQNGVEEKM